MMDSKTDDNLGSYLQIRKHLQFITQRGIRKSTLIMPQENYTNFLNLAETLLKNSFFYLMTFDESTKLIKWRQILTMNNSTQVISNDLKFDDYGRIIEYYDLQGITYRKERIELNLGVLGFRPSMVCLENLEFSVSLK